MSTEQKTLWFVIFKTLVEKVFVIIRNLDKTSRYLRNTFIISLKKTETVLKQLLTHTVHSNLECYSCKITEVIGRSSSK